jgi:DNA polymerase III subunit beta
MKFQCSRKDLYEALQTVTRAVSGRSTLPILSNVLIEPDSTTVQMAATDLELGIKCSFNASVNEKGPITVPAKTISDIVSQLPEADVTIAVDDRNTAVVTCRRSEYRILGLPSEEFPPLPEVGNEVSFTIPQKLLHQMVRYTAIAASTDDTRPILTGVCTTLTGNKLRMAATDTHRLALRTCEVSEANGDRTVIIPGRAMTEMMRALSADSPEPVNVRLDANQVMFATETVTLVSRLIEGQFPKFERVIPTSHTKKLTIPVAEFHQAVRRASIVAREASNRIVLRTDGENLTVTAQAGDLGNAYEELEVVREGDDIEIVFNYRYLLDVLGVLEGDGLYLEMSEPLAPAVIRTVDDGDYLMVIMPMQLQ